MPRILVACAGLLIGACSFDADYTGATIFCSDSEHKCPSGLECRTELATPVCGEPRRDAAVDALPDVMIDARPYALTCNDPQPIVPPSAPIMGNTSGRSNMLSVSCNGSNMLGFDTVYRLDNVAAGKQVNLSITATWNGAAAYVIQPCATGGSCIGNTYAQSNVPVNITTIASGPPYIVVDSTLSGTNGPYTLNVTVN